MPDATPSFLHISDLHILGDAHRRQHGADTAAILRQAIPMMSTLRPDFLIASGDLVSDESEASYRRLQSLLEPLGVPVHFLMGNDDDRAAFRRVFRPNDAHRPIQCAKPSSTVRLAFSFWIPYCRARWRVISRTSSSGGLSVNCRPIATDQLGSSCIISRCRSRCAGWMPWASGTGRSSSRSWPGIPRWRPSATDTFIRFDASGIAVRSF